MSGGALIAGSVSNAGKINLTDSFADFGSGLNNAGTANLLDTTVVGARDDTDSSAINAGGHSSIAAGAAKASKTDRLSIASGGNLDLNDNDLIVGGAGTFGGQSYSPADTLVKSTWYGDTDFNGVVNFDDYARIDAGFNGRLSGWLHGDFDLNGVVNFDDYTLIDLAFNTQTGPLQSVPEPSVVGLLSLVTFCASRRRRPPSFRAQRGISGWKVRPLANRDSSLRSE